MIWIAYNGWRGNAPVAVIVEASDEEAARAATLFELGKEAGTKANPAQWARIEEIHAITTPFVCEIDAAHE